LGFLGLKGEEPERGGASRRPLHPLKDRQTKKQELTNWVNRGGKKVGDERPETPLFKGKGFRDEGA